jgi:hypothetical protein
VMDAALLETTLLETTLLETTLLETTIPAGQEPGALSRFLICKGTMRQTRMRYVPTPPGMSQVERVRELTLLARLRRSLVKVRALPLRN